MRPRLTIKQQMGFVVLAALVSALVVFSIRQEVGPVRGLVAIFLGLAILAAIRLRGRRRAAFAVGGIVGWVYFSGSILAITSMPTTPRIVRFYDVTIGAPITIAPDEVVPFVLRVVAFVSIGHAIAALLVGVIAGTITLALVSLFGKRSAKKVPLPDVDRGV